MELDRPTWFARLRQRAAPSAYVRAARAQGFEARAYWHYPNFEMANRILPLSDPEPLQHVIAKGQDHLKARLKQCGAAALLNMGLLELLLPSVSVVGYRS